MSRHGAQPPNRQCARGYTLRTQPGPTGAGPTWSMRVGLRSCLLPRWSFDCLSSHPGPGRNVAGSRASGSSDSMGAILIGAPTVDPKLPEAFSDWGSDFSPDGKRLVFDRSRVADERHAVFVQPMSSPEDPRRITPWKLNCQDRPVAAPTVSWCSSAVCPRADEVPPTSTGSIPMAQASTSF